MRIEILGVPINAITRIEARRRMERMLDERRPHVIVTPNPEMLVLAQKDADFRKILCDAELALPDGVGLRLAARWRGERIPERISGADFIDDVAAAAAKRGSGLFLLGSTGNVAVRAAEALKKRHPALRIAGAISGGRVGTGSDGKFEIAFEFMDAIRRAAPDVILVAFGHGIQEKWIKDNLPSLPSVRLALGVGGAFDFISGAVRRAPVIIRQLGLEWLWRLMLEPRRFRRIWTAVVIFPYLALKEKH